QAKINALKKVLLFVLNEDGFKDKWALQGRTAEKYAADARPGIDILITHLQNVDGQVMALITLVEQLQSNDQELRKIIAILEPEKARLILQIEAQQQRIAELDGAARLLQNRNEEQQRRITVLE